jgi:hypothetical protein
VIVSKPSRSFPHWLHTRPLSIPAPVEYHIKFGRSLSANPPPQSFLFAASLSFLSDQSSLHAPKNSMRSNEKMHLDQVVLPSQVFTVSQVTALPYTLFTTGCVTSPLVTPRKPSPPLSSQALPACAWPVRTGRVQGGCSRRTAG